MGFASSNRIGVYAVKEVTMGVVPTNPVFETLRITSESVNFNITNTNSAELRSDRMDSGAVQTGAESAGDMNFEFSAKTFDTLLESGLADEFKGGLVATRSFDVSEVVAATNKFVTSTNPTSNASFKVGRWVKTVGLSAENTGFFKIVTVAADGITVEGTLTNETVTVGTDAKVIAGERLINGVKESSYLIQKFIQDADTPTYLNYHGMRVNTVNFSVSVGAIVTGSFSFIGLNSEAVETQYTGSTINPPSTTDPMSSVSDIMDVMIDDLPVGCFNSLTVAINNSLRGQDCVGKLGHVGIAFGSLEVTGNISLYFRNKYDYDKYVNSEYGSISFRFEDNARNAYVLTIPRMKYETGSIVAGGKDQDLMFEGTYRAQADPATNSMIIIDRFVD
ncbi:MAG: phage tail tube protein [Acinetobacter sp.]